VQKQIKEGHFKGLGKLFKAEEAPSGGMSGLVGSIGPALKPSKVMRHRGLDKSSKKKEKSAKDSGDEDEKQNLGKHVSLAGEKVQYKSLLQKRNKRPEDEEGDA